MKLPVMVVGSASTCGPELDLLPHILLNSYQYVSQIVRVYWVLYSLLWVLVLGGLVLVTG